MAQPSKKLLTGIAIAVVLVIGGFIFVNRQAGEPMDGLTGGFDVGSATTTEELPGSITSVTIEPSRQEGPWTLYKKGAVLRVRGENLSKVVVKAMPTGSGAAEEYPDGLVIGEATSLSSQRGVWALPLPDSIMATSLWIEATDLNGKVVKSEDFGNVGYEE
ncbi:MAG TPA: hypothetical protein VEB60_00155 [Candidatus Paceibacterota bacterium]|nr:hypothetical protein [Candidatus Paceibacterota bacterium]